MPRTRSSASNAGSKYFYPFSLSNPSSPSSSRPRHRSKGPKTFSPPPSPPPRPPPRARPRRVHPPPLFSPLNILLALVAFRLTNALILRTFFQPDEFYQSLEPAWQLAFGTEQGAWMTWEWRNQLRSSLHPLLFAAIYRVVDLLALILHVSPATRANLLVVAPKTAQAVVAAFGDFYTWKFARRVYGEGSRKTWTVLALTVVSPWQWFCSTRTLSNCLETTITILALDLWPWQWSVNPDERAARKTSRSRSADRDVLVRVRQCFCLAALACILRPTNILIWITLAGLALYRNTWDVQKTLIREAAICGSALLAISAPVDRLFYGVWTFPPLNFLYFNVAQSLAVFYGANDFSYYVTQGLPLLLTTALPFTLISLYRIIKHQRSAEPKWQTVQSQLALICLVMPLILSLISHKEVRFIYPLLPSLHLLTASPLVEFFGPAIPQSSGPYYTPRRLTLIFILVVNAVIALYTTIYHASGTINILSYLRDQHDRHASSTPDAKVPTPGITAGFLMPCHSTPWRSHMVYPTIHAWALTCEPPVNLNASEKAAYLDEADQFYENPTSFLKTHMHGGLRHNPRKPSYLTIPSRQSRGQQPETHDWPDYLIFFAQLETTLSANLPKSSYAECHRTFNTAWHDDWRRRGDVVVWCLDPGEQMAWRAHLARERERRAMSFTQRWGIWPSTQVVKNAGGRVRDGLGTAWRAGSSSVTSLASGMRSGKGWWPARKWSSPGQWMKSTSTSTSKLLPWSKPKSHWKPWPLPWQKQKKRSWGSVPSWSWLSWSWPSKGKSTKEKRAAPRDLWS